MHTLKPTYLVRYLISSVPLQESLSLLSRLPEKPLTQHCRREEGEEGEEGEVGGGGGRWGEVGGGGGYHWYWYPCNPVRSSSLYLCSMVDCVILGSVMAARLCCSLRTEGEEEREGRRRGREGRGEGRRGKGRGGKGRGGKGRGG